MYSVHVVHTIERGMEGGMSGGTLLPLILINKTFKNNIIVNVTLCNYWNHPQYACCSLILVGLVRIFFYL